MFDGRSLFQLTAERCRDLDGFQSLTIVTSARYEAVVRAQLSDMGMSYRLLLEPEGRDSAPAVACAVMQIDRSQKQATVVLLAADHYVPDCAHFVDDIDHAARAAQDGSIVLLGIKPSHASSAYGYIQPGEQSQSSLRKKDDQTRVKPVMDFKEKPDTETATDYIRNGYLWNSGNFIATTATMLSEFAEHAPKIYALAETVLDDALVLDNGLAMGERFLTMPRISIDYAIMEKTALAEVLPSDLNWSDLGAWDAVRDSLPRDSDGNAIRGDAILNACHGCLVHSDDRQIVVCSELKDVGVIVEPDAILVVNLNAAQSVKNVVNELSKRGRQEESKWVGPGFDVTSFLHKMRTWLPVTALPVWTTLGIDHTTGLWRESIEQDGSPTHSPVRARVQGRQNTVLGAAARQGWQGPWQPLLERALESADSTYAGPDGLYVTLVASNGGALDSSKLVYDQTFRLLALANIPESLFETLQAQQRARTLMDTITSHFAGGKNGVSQLSEAGEYPKAANPMMHLFEACLEWLERDDPDGYWKSKCQEIADLAVDVLFAENDPCIREFFEEDWSRRTDSAGDILDPGHQFEWAWLLARWSALSGDERAVEVAKALHDTGLDKVHPQTGAVPLSVNTKTNEYAPQYRFWSQLERVKASLYLVDMTDGESAVHYRDDAVLALKVMAQYLDTPIDGLWYDSMRADGSFEQGPSPASTFYHIAGALAQMRATGPRLIEALQDASQGRPA